MLVVSLHLDVFNHLFALVVSLACRHQTKISLPTSHIFYLTMETFIIVLLALTGIIVSVSQSPFCPSIDSELEVQVQLFVLV